MARVRDIDKPLAVTGEDNAVGDVMYVSTTTVPTSFVSQGEIKQVVSTSSRGSETINGVRI